MGTAFRFNATTSENVTFNSAATVPITTTAFTITGSVLNVALNYAPTPGTVLTVINNTGTSAISGRFTNLPDGGTISATYDGVTFTFTANYEGGDGNDLTLTGASYASYASWKNYWFTVSDLNTPTVSGDTAAPAGDGIPNLMKCALNLNPKADGTAGLPVPGTIAAGGSNYLTLSYTHVIPATDIIYTVQVSGDLQSWNSGAGYPSVVSKTPNPGGLTQTIVVQDLIPVSGTNRRFMRLQVTPYCANEK